MTPEPLYQYVGMMVSDDVFSEDGEGIDRVTTCFLLLLLLIKKVTEKNRGIVANTLLQSHII